MALYLNISVNCQVSQNAGIHSTKQQQQQQQQHIVTDMWEQSFFGCIYNHSLSSSNRYFPDDIYMVSSEL
jgi:hypothetical protein